MSSTTADNGASSYSGAVIAVNAVVSVVVSLALIWVVNGFNVFYEELPRVSPTVPGGGIGANWVSGNEIGWMKIMVDAIHIIDIIMGLFILLMVFIHWGAFRRLASRMRQPTEQPYPTDADSPVDSGVDRDTTGGTLGGENE